MPLSSYVLDNGLATFQSEADKIYICNAQPTTYTEATSTFALGNKNQGTGNVLSGPTDADDGTGRQVTVLAVTGGTQTAAGTATWWAIVNSSASRLLATDQLGTAGSMAGSGSWTLPAFNILVQYGLDLEDETEVWMAEVVANGGTVSTARGLIVNDLYIGLKVDGLLAKLDRLWLFAAENSQSALTDLLGGNLATVVSTPTFTTDRGYTGEDLVTPTKYINTGYNPSANGVTFTQNSAHASAWCVGNVASTNGGNLFGCSVSNNYISIADTFTDGNIYSNINNAGGASRGAPGTRAGHWLVNRSGASASQLYQNASNFSNPSDSSLAPQNAKTYALCANVDGTPNLGTPNQVAMLSFGGNLSSTDVTNFYNRLRTYMTAVGVP